MVQPSPVSMKVRPSIGPLTAMSRGRNAKEPSCSAWTSGGECRKHGPLALRGPAPTPGPFLFTSGAVELAPVASRPRLVLALMGLWLAAACGPCGFQPDPGIKIIVPAMPTTLDWSYSDPASWSNYPVMLATQKGLTTPGRRQLGAARARRALGARARRPGARGLHVPPAPGRALVGRRHPAHRAGLRLRVAARDAGPRARRDGRDGRGAGGRWRCRSAALPRSTVQAALERVGRGGAGRRTPCG